MTKEELSQLKTLRQELSYCKSRLRRVEKEIDNADAKQTKKSLLCEFKRESEIINERILMCKREENKLLEYINTISEADIRMLFTLRYVDGIRSWQKIAFMVGEHDESYVRRKHDRYINRRI